MLVAFIALRRLVHVLGLGVVLAAAASFVEAGIRAGQYDAGGAVVRARWLATFPAAVLLASFGVLAWLAIFAALARRLPSPTTRGGVATALVGLAPALVVGRLVNHHLLPGFWERASLVGNVVLALALLALGLLVSCVLVRWKRTALARDAAPLLTGSSLVAIVLAGFGLHRSLREPPGPNVFILLIDVLGAKHLGCYGYERATSAHIDRFAQDAVLFEQASSASTFTKTSVSSLFTGLAPYHHGVYVGNLKDTADQVTSDVLGHHLTVMAEEMKRCGFVTLGFVHNGQLRPYMGFDQGFDVYDNEPGPLPVMAARFRELRGRLARSQRLFTYFHVLELHAPYLPSPAYATRFGRYSDTYDKMELHDGWEKYVAAVNMKDVVPTKDDLEQLRALHDAQLVYVDEWIGRILDELKAEGLYDDSLIVLLGDHGEAFWEHGFVSHSNRPYQELIHVPLLIKLPGSRNGGARVGAPVGLVDLLPTLLEWAGEASSAALDGTSFLELLEDPGAEPARPGVYIAEYMKTAAIREGNWKLLYRPDRPLELYDLARDPGERTNLQAVETEAASRLERRLAALLEARENRNEAERVVVDPETVRQLKALGY